MAMDYDGANTGVFTHLGKIIKHYNQFADDANDGSTGLAADRKEILDKFQAGDQDVAIDGLVGAYERWKSEYIQRRSTISGFALSRLQDIATVINEIGASSSSQAEILDKLITQMNTDTETVNASSVTLGSVTAGAGNTGNGTLLRTEVLDGATSPGIVDGISMPSHAEYNGLDSELTVPAETWRFRVTGDSFQDGLEEGTEQLSWEGDVADQPHGIDAEGSGFIDTLTPINSAGLLTDGEFEEFTSNTPDNWTIDAGTAGTHIFEETNAANIYHGAAGLKFTGDGAQANIQISQAIDAASVVANKAYVVTALIKASSSITNGALTIQFEGTGYTAGGSEKISIAAGSLPTSFTLQHFFINLPGVIPGDLKLVIKWTGTPTNAKNLWVDDVAFGPVTYGAGGGVVAVRGSTPFVRNDRFTITVANTEGVIQSFFRRVFGVQLPSSGSPSIADSLAT